MTGTEFGAEVSVKNDTGSRRYCWILCLVLLISGFVRMWRLGSLPPGIFRDEAEKALNGWFLWQGGVDVAGRPWPIFIDVFGVTTSAIYQYSTIPFVAIGGLNEWTARLPAAVIGVLTVLFTWLFCRHVWGRQTAVWAAALLAISPWHVPLSRWAQQGIFLPFFFVVAAWGISVFLGERGELRDGIDMGWPVVEPVTIRSTLALCLSAGCVALAMYTYDPARLFAPLLALVAAVIWWRAWLLRWRSVLVALVVFLVFASPIIWLLATQGDAAQTRFRFLSIFQPGVSIFDALARFGKNYFSHFSPEFLLIHGDHELRHSGGVGMLNFAGFVFAVAGASFAICRKSRWGWFMVVWVLLSPVAASFTRIGVPHALRSQMSLPAWQILAGVGIVEIAERFQGERRKLVGQVVALLILLGAMPFFFSYFGSYAARSAVNWQYGVKQSLAYVNNPPLKSSEVYFHNVVGVEYLVPFYLGMDRGEYQKFLRGMTRYQIMPFHPDIVVPPVNVHGAAAWVTLPGYQWSSDLFAVPIRLQNEMESPPAMLILLNRQLLDQVKETIKQ